MSQVRNKAVRGRRNRIVDDSRKLDIFRALYYLVYNDDKDIVPLATELFHVLGEILEGTSPRDLHLYRINKEELLRYAFMGNAVEMKGILTEKSGVDLSDTKPYEWNVPKASR